MLTVQFCQKLFSSGSKRQYFPTLPGGPHVEPSRALLAGRKLAVVLEDFGGAVPGFQRHLGGVLNVGEAVGAEGMPETIVDRFHFRRAESAGDESGKL